ncbi:hypothetical protein BDV37DRAFT_281163 [Aspergillus pseudonomiae]|uniref:Uncharacterized protein n=1 Tax=Aspergillus pseudonomiae TaxID=1506151 RepID=A0A5N7DJR1_9EURO|nr:uncharacterized protein BDV37DRAFT_281163 [Aspergillus pseudonomiae]KAE8406253.1 hypothetical protein BDV37DRAFT_281163 [Aspergillus pseudonomiae]
MPPQIRPLSDGSVKPFFHWCMHCQRLCAGRYKRETDRPFEIDCYFNSKGFIHCHQCSHDNTACDSVAPGMLGNGWDYSRILRWATRYWDTQEGNEDEYEWPENVRASIVSALRELNSAFNKTEEAHRREHALTGDNDDVMATYRTFVENRRRLPVQRSLPNEYDWEEDWDCYQSSRLLRLLPGDSGYVLWMVALRVFREAVEDAITSCAVLHGSGRRIINEELESFPVECEKI